MRTPSAISESAMRTAARAYGTRGRRPVSQNLVQSRAVKSPTSPGSPRAVSSQRASQSERHHAEERRSDPEAHHHARLRPPELLEVVVVRRDEEDPLAATP